MSFLQLEGRVVVVFGVSNKKSVGFVSAKVLAEAGATVLLVSHTPERAEGVKRYLPGAEVYACDVEVEGAVAELAAQITEKHPVIHGVVHAIAYANYSEGILPFESVPRADFMQAMQISCHSLSEICAALRPNLADDASILTISISTTRMAADNYGYMAPVKAALDSAVVFLAKSFSSDSRVRVNAIAPGLLKTRSSAGIPGYVDSYLYAEAVIPRGEGVKTQEVADAVAFMLSPRSSGINAQKLVIDAGMEINYFDRSLIKR